MLALAGDLADFEDATRALYARDFARFERLSEFWPRDVGEYVRRLARRLAAMSASD
jgi:hypothetical protein